MQYFLTNPAAVRAACLVEHLDADPLGVRMATPAGSPVVVLAAPWIRRRELAAGVHGLTVAAYILAGPVDLEGVSWQVYAGESGDFPERLARHARDPAKGFVNMVFLITSRDPEFGKQTVQALQFLIDRTIERTGRASILRGVRPSEPRLHPDDWCRLESLLAAANIGLLALGCRLLEPARPAHGPVLEAPEAEENTPSATPPRGKGAGATAAEADHGRSGQTTLAGPIEPRRLVLQHNDVWAHALALDGSVTIRAGSEIRKTAYATMSPGIVQARQTCCDEHALVDMPGDTTRWRLVRDVVVPSATFAVRFVTGCHLDGRAWQPLA
ncbi:hypothetical protein FV227_14735 [Methylobacterium sp. WL119]|uniref:hypothetical protein n=1 Tax=unclassified Methylobacterium TaxID=2615210 RepID=UPI0011C6ED0F|nr:MULTISPECIES: hypothetical protein [unclassified Methylobacterium]TXN34490.1 hypothetical protein FV225_16470 [Methylobacterium sp. WL93]TXN49839.1 hypothetical protein FV227_14735 [Methylobacterium sp. WL119]